IEPRGCGKNTSPHGGFLLNFLPGIGEHPNNAVVNRHTCDDKSIAGRTKSASSIVCIMLAIVTSGCQVNSAESQWQSLKNRAAQPASRGDNLQAQHEYQAALKIAEESGLGEVQYVISLCDLAEFYAKIAKQENSLALFTKAQDAVTGLLEKPANGSLSSQS